LGGTAGVLPLTARGRRPLCRFKTGPRRRRADTLAVRADALVSQIWDTDGSRHTCQSVCIAPLELGRAVRSFAPTETDIPILDGSARWRHKWTLSDRLRPHGRKMRLYPAPAGRRIVTGPSMETQTRPKNASRFSLCGCCAVAPSDRVCCIRVR
jgi:hypothetical protein